MEYLIFIILWIVTFLPAWYFLLKLIAFAGSKKKLVSLEFLSLFTTYQLLLALPYLYLLVFGDESVPGFVKLIALSAVAVGVLLSFVRFFLANQINNLLWNIYGRVYDGLLDFYPYIKLQQEVADSVEAKSGAEILDLGCGSGNQSMLLCQSGAYIKAVDSSSSMLRQFKNKISKNSIKNIEVIQEDLMDYIAYESQKYDKIVLVNVLYAVSDRDKLFAELLRCLKTDGELIITNSDKAGSRTLIREHINNRGFISLFKPKLMTVFVIDSLISELAKSGHFSFISEGEVKSEIQKAGGKYHFISRCYGDVNILFKVTKK